MEYRFEKLERLDRLCGDETTIRDFRHYVRSSITDPWVRQVRATGESSMLPPPPTIDLSLVPLCTKPLYCCELPHGSVWFAHMDGK